MSLQTGESPEPSPSELGTAPVNRRRPSLWRQGDFMKLWTGQTISQFGDEVTGLALPFVAILTLGADALEMGILGVVRFLPWILFTLPAGVWVDRMRRRPILIGADIARAAILASIPIAFVGGWLTMLQVYVVSFLAGTLEVFFDVAYQSYLPSIVERDELVEGNSKLELSRAGSSVDRPHRGGLPGRGGPGADRHRLRRDQLPRRRALHRRHQALRGRSGAPRTHRWRPTRACGRRRWPAWAMFGTARTCATSPPAPAPLNLFGNIGQVVMLLYIVEVLGLSAGTIGIIFAIGNIGVAGRCPQRRPAGEVHRRRADHRRDGAALGRSPFVLVPLAPVDDPFWFLVAEGMIAGFTAVVYNVNQVGLRQAITPDRMLGRMNATMRLIVWGTIPIGALIGGLIGTSSGSRPRSGSRPSVRSSASCPYSSLP